MTDGSSQGLFVVVAVVIFGIFVAISYMLFRDQLTPSLASIFSVATEQAGESFKSKRKIPLIELTANTDYSSKLADVGGILQTTYKGSSGTHTISIRTAQQTFEVGKKYEITGTLTLNGEPITLEQWFVKNNNNMSSVSPEVFEVDNTTGNFKIVYTFKEIGTESGNRSRIIHNKFLRPDKSNIQDGDIFGMKGLTVYELNDG